MEKEERIRALTKLYYSNPKIQECIVEFSKNREVVPRYFEAFGKRPDTIQYPSDVMGLVNKGATSFHASEELWREPLQLNSEMSAEEMNGLREGWDLLIDVDSPFLDCSKIATKLLIAALEHHGIKNCGVKFSGNKGFHLIVSWKAFPKVFDNKKTKEMFPEWPRAICSYLMDYIRKDYNKLAADVLTDFKAIKERTNLGKEELEEVYCILSNRAAKKGIISKFVCSNCGMEIERKDVKPSKKRLRCLNNKCGGVLEEKEKKEYFYCDYTKDPQNPNFFLSSDKYPEYFEKVRGVSAEKIAALDLVLVAPRHLFRMPYSLHEKTALASIVLNKEEIDNFSPKDADALKVKIRSFIPESRENEGEKLLSSAIQWDSGRKAQEEKKQEKKNENYKEMDLKGVKEEMFPAPIKKLMNGLKEGKKRGLFILITFLRSLNFPNEYVDLKVHEWNKKNEPQLKEGYIRSQLEWHFRQKKKILPPNYDNQSFYKDIGLLESVPKTKNPIVDVLIALRKNR